MDPAIAFPLMLLPFVAVIALLFWNLNATRRAMAEGEPATWTRPRPAPPAAPAPELEPALFVANGATEDDASAIALMRAELERRREELDRRAEEIAEKEARLAQRD
jgi:hypothetical protein